MKLLGVVVLSAVTALGAARPAAASALYVTNTKSSSVSIIDTDMLEVVGTDLVAVIDLEGR